MRTDSALELELTAASAAWNDLAEGLKIVRASNLKLIRLQLALARHDRRVALEAVDDLVDLDRSLQERLAGMRATNQHTIMDLALAIERDTLNREKLVLAAGVISKEASLIAPPPPERIEPVHDASEADPNNGEAAAGTVPNETAPEPLHLMDESMDEFSETGRTYRIIWWVVAFAVLLSTAAVTALLLDFPAAIEWLRAAWEELG